MTVLEICTPKSFDIPIHPDASYSDFQVYLSIVFPDVFSGLFILKLKDQILKWE